MIDGDDVGVGRPDATALRSRTFIVSVDRSLAGRLYAAEMKPDRATREYKIGAIAFCLRCESLLCCSRLICWLNDWM